MGTRNADTEETDPNGGARHAACIGVHTARRKETDKERCMVSLCERFLFRRLALVPLTAGSPVMRAIGRSETQWRSSLRPQASTRFSGCPSAGEVLRGAALEPVLPQATESVLKEETVPCTVACL